MNSEEFEEELIRQIEINKEKEKLKDVIKEINNQILTLIDVRKKVTGFIVKYREKNLEEYRDDEDKQVDYFDHELFVKEEQFKLVDKKLRNFTLLKESPYFGKVSFKDKYGGDTIYVGRFGVTSEQNYEPIVVDWRSPVSALFYEGKLGKTSYNAPEGTEKADILAKRQFIIKKGQLKGMFDSSLNVKDEILQMVLSKNASEKLNNIVMTIQKEQDNVIRQPKNGIVVVEGSAGSGKTTIALHRVAYLLYNHRKEFQNNVLIFGPNSIFMDYISIVLPSLGEEGVAQTTFREFFADIMGEKSILNFKDYMEKVLNNEEGFRDSIVYKRSIEYIADIDDLVDDLEENYFKVKNVKFYDRIIVKKEEIQDMLKISFKHMPLFKRTERIIRVINSRIRDERNSRVKKVQEDYDKMISSMGRDELNNIGTELEFRRKNKIRDILREVIRIKTEDLLWLKNPDILQVYNEYNKNREIIYEDLAPILYLKIKLEGLKYKKRVKHVVIDEAQEYSALEFMVIRELTGCRSFTIVGDTNQLIIPSCDQCDMKNLKNIFSDLEVKYFFLDTSYRSTSQIIDYANRYLPSDENFNGVRNGCQVVERNIYDLDELVEYIITGINELKQRGYESIAVICRDIKEVEILRKLIEKRVTINVFNDEYMIYSGGKVILPSYFAKGLEFDAVIMINNGTGAMANEDKLKYIMCTRALHQLYVYNIFNVF